MHLDLSHRNYLVESCDHLVVEDVAGALSSEVRFALAVLHELVGVWGSKVSLYALAICCCPWCVCMGPARRSAPPLGRRLTFGLDLVSGPEASCLIGKIILPLRSSINFASRAFLVVCSDCIVIQPLFPWQPYRLCCCELAQSISALLKLLTQHHPHVRAPWMAAVRRVVCYFSPSEGWSLASPVAVLLHSDLLG